jgi:hypothetical protein
MRERVPVDVRMAIDGIALLEEPVVEVDSTRDAEFRVLERIAMQR